MRFNIRRQINKQNRKLLIPTRIAIFMCAFFYMLMLLASQFFILSIGHNQVRNFGQAQYRLIDQATKSDELFRYKDYLELKQKGLPHIGEMWSDLTVYCEIDNAKTPIGAQFYVSPSAEYAKYSSLKLEEGTWPKEGEAVLPDSLQKQVGLKLGDTFELKLRSYKGDEATEHKSLKLVGITKDQETSFTYTGALLNEKDFNDILAFSGDTDDLAAGVVYLFTDTHTVLKGDALAELEQALPANLTMQDFYSSVNFEVNATLNGQNFNPISIILLTFVFLAIAVSTLVIFNTFQVLVARQRKTFALLRAIGATRQQIYRQVLLDGLSLGLTSSLFGAAIPLLITYILETLGVGINGIPLVGVPHLQYMIQPVLVMTVVTVLSVLSSARTATKIHPLEALRPLELSVRQKKGLVSKILGAILLVIGAALVIFSLFSIWNINQLDVKDLSGAEGYLLMILLGGFFTFISLMMTAKFWIPLLLRGIGAIWGKFDPAANIASANIQQNPRRASITGVALLIGITLVSSIATGAASVQETVFKTLDEQTPIDLMMSTGVEQQASLEELIQKMPRVFSQTMEPKQVTVTNLEATNLAEYESEANQKEADSLAGPAPYYSLILLPEAVDSILHTGMPKLADDEVMIGENTLNNLNYGRTKASELVDGSQIKIRVMGKEQQVTLRVNELASKLDSDPQTLYSRNQTWLQAATTEKKMIWAQSNKDVGYGDFRELISEISQNPQINTGGSLILRVAFKTLINAVMIILLILIGVSVAIAIVGVSNTLILSIIERKHEIATLRVIGMTRKQLRKSLYIEALLLSLVSIVTGILLGFVFGYLGTIGTVGQVNLDDLRFAIHVPVTVGLVVFGVVGSILTSIVPARNALKVSPIEAMLE